MSRTIHRSIIQFCKGFCMGAADIVPGVSGGTMAFVLGIYEELINSIRLFGRPQFWGQIRKGNIVAALRLPNWAFLFSVGGGILCAGVLLAHPLEYALEVHPTLVWSFFFGLVLASVVVVAARITAWKLHYVGALLLGALAAYALVGLVPVSTPDDAWFLVLCGAITICAMILPGISGAFLLVLLGKYEFVLSAVNNRDLVPIAEIGLGAVVGLILFSQVLGWLFARYHNITVALLTGMMLGSLRKIWPWKLEDINVLPAVNSTTLILLCIAAAGAMIVFGIEWLAKRSRS